MSKPRPSFTPAAEDKTAPTPATAADQRKKRRETQTTIQSLDRDILCTIFAFLDMFDLVRCSVVCKFWVSQCRMKMGMVVTGVGDKVIRLWSLDSYKCIEEYSIPDMFSLVDFDFDESKIVGLIGSRLCIWRRNGKRSVFPSLEGKFVKGSCMRYFDPEAVVGCDDGAVRVFDMYSRRCSQIIREYNNIRSFLCSASSHT